MSSAPGQEPTRVDDKAEQFQQLWEGRSRGAIVIPIPDDYQEYLKQVAPQTDPTKPKPPPVPPQDERDLLWSRIRDAIANDPGNHRRDGGGGTLATPGELPGAREQQGQAPTGFSSPTRWDWARRFRLEYSSRPASTRARWTGSSS